MFKHIRIWLILLFLSYMAVTANAQLSTPQPVRPVPTITAHNAHDMHLLGVATLEDVTHIALLTDGTLQAERAGGEMVTIWQLSEGYTAIPEASNRAFNPAGDVLAVIGQDGAVWLWNIPQTQLATIVYGHHAGIQHMLFTPDGRFLVGLDADGQIYLWGVGLPLIWGCTIQPDWGEVNIRSAPSTAEENIIARFSKSPLSVIGYSEQSDGRWWAVYPAGWVFSEVVEASGYCDAIPPLQP
ncbi:MAG: hypothetical protein D6712_09740 [Chloroflexi bacterium]|nr:MAG: hypothetical protein D6712_09740 [Chloroflexota bacterium]